MIPLTFDYMFKGFFISNKEILKKLIISSLHLDEIKDDSTITFASKDFLKENYKEYNKQIDMHTIINDNLHISVEINTEHFSDIKLSSIVLYLKVEKSQKN